MLNEVSIIVCCYNSIRKLPNTLEHLARQKVSANLPYEVIIVDNASNDGTAEFAISYWNALNTCIPLRVVREENSGLMHARVCGVQAAQYELLLFCDDDNWLREDYVQNAVDIMNADATIGVLGGQSVLAPYIEAPDWWEEHQGNYAVGKQMPTTGCANSRGFVYGAGLVTRKSIAVKIFDSKYPLLLIGRKGSQCLSGEDWEFCQRVLLLGYDLYYSEDLFYWHDISVDRLTMYKLEQLLYSFELGKPIQQRYEYVQKYYKRSFLYNIVLLIKRLCTYLLSKRIEKKRKLELLIFQMQICGWNFFYDVELQHILRWIKTR